MCSYKNRDTDHLGISQIIRLRLLLRPLDWIPRSLRSEESIQPTTGLIKMRTWTPRINEP